jgi:hypothetical protein
MGILVVRIVASLRSAQFRLPLDGSAYQIPGGRAFNVDLSIRKEIDLEAPRTSNAT